MDEQHDLALHVREVEVHRCDAAASANFYERGRFWPGEYLSLNSPVR